MLHYRHRYNIWNDVLILLLALVAISALVLLYFAYPEDCPDVVVSPYKCPSLECSDCPDPVVTVQVECPEPVVSIILPLPETGDIER